MFDESSHSPGANVTSIDVAFQAAIRTSYVAKVSRPMRQSTARIICIPDSGCLWRFCFSMKQRESTAVRRLDTNGSHSVQ